MKEKTRQEGKILEKIRTLILIACILLTIIIFTLSGLDYIISEDNNGQLKVVSTSQVPCIDQKGREFQNELCTKEKTCSKLGLVGDMRCNK